MGRELIRTHQAPGNSKGRWDTRLLKIGPFMEGTGAALAGAPGSCEDDARNEVSSTGSQAARTPSAR